MNEEIKNLIRRGWLNQFVAHSERCQGQQPNCQPQRPPYAAPPPEQPLAQPLMCDVHTIIKGARMLWDIEQVP